MGSEVGFSYALFKIMKVLLKSFVEGSSSLADIFHKAVGACGTIYAALLVLLVRG